MTNRPDDVCGTGREPREPTFAEALRWFPDMPRPWGALGWKDHRFEFLYLWNGSLVMSPLGASAGPGGRRRDRTRDPARDPAQFTFFPTTADSPWRMANIAHAADENSIALRMEPGLPIARFEHRDGGVLVEQQVFAHAAGGKRLRHGNEPLFAWVRFEIREILGRVKHPPMLSVWTHIGGLHFAAGMTPGINAVADWPAPAYPHRMFVVDGGRVVQDDGSTRLHATAGGGVEFAPVPDGPNRENFLRARIPCRVGETAVFLVPFLAVGGDTVDRELDLGWDGALAETHRFWERNGKAPATIRVPDELPNRTIEALPWQIFTLAERDPAAGERIHSTGAFHYEGVWATPFAAANGWGLDYLGFHRDAEAYLELFRRHQGEVAPPSDHTIPHDGFFTTPARFETVNWISDHGAILFASALHALLTDDAGFIDRWLPAWERGLDWIAVQRGAVRRPFVPGLLPPGQATDDFQQYQFVWNDGWAFLGMREVVRVLDRIGHPNAARYREELDDYRRRFLRALRRAARAAGTFTTGDGRTFPFVPTNVNTPLAPANDEAFYLDTGPLFAVFAGLVPADDPLADAVLAFFRDGPHHRIFRPESSPWQLPVLTHEISSCEPCYSWNIGLSLARGERAAFAEGLFALITGGQSRRNLWDVETRNGVFGLCGVTPVVLRHLRHAVIDDDDDDLHLLRMPPLDWLRDDGIVMRRVPTRFGPMSLEVRLDGSATVRARVLLPRRNPPARILLHLPPVGEVEDVRIGRDRIDPLPAPVRIDPARTGRRFTATIRYRATGG